MDCSNDAAAWIAIVVSLFALGVAVFQAYLSRHESRRTVAMTMYKSYLDLAMANPDFVFASQPPQSPAFYKITSDPIARTKYDFYV